ncbi:MULTISPECIES: hypothetical protein [unclassified Methanosarcina]|uniref:hypothetical protein n=1 Tax=unclassified Methanosarcina TaxID=2644672 RepID=UPI000B2C5502|nr:MULTISPECIES: hypothetical protein [unclassified Methanosarcina]
MISLKRGVIQGEMEGFLWIFTRRPESDFCSREYRLRTLYREYRHTMQMYPESQVCTSFRKYTRTPKLLRSMGFWPIYNKRFKLILYIIC